jgi:glycosyltransferase involved in cell wall biosynthesis
MAEELTRRWRIVHSEVSLGWGGQEHRILAELTGFQKRGGEVRLLAPANSQIFRRSKMADIRCEPLAEARWQFPFAVLKVAAWLRRVRPDVVNTHSSRDGWLVGLAARLARVPLIVRTRHFDVPIPNPKVSRWVYTRLADHVLTTSTKVAAHFQELFGLPPDRISTIPTGIDLKLFSANGPTVELMPKERRRDRPLVGMISVLRLAKGHETLFQAARCLRDSAFPVHCIIVGDGPRTYLDQKVREMGLTDAVTFLGHRENIPAVLRAINVLAIPSLHEGIPQIGLQALATKTPVVASNVGGIPEIIREGETGRLVPPGDAVALARAIREALTDTAASAAMAERGRALVEREHSLDAMLDKLDVLYRRYLRSTA